MNFCGFHTLSGCNYIKSIPFNTDCGDRIFSGSSDGRLVHWDPVKGDNDVVKGKGHTSQIQALVPKGKDQLLSIGVDDQLKTIDIAGEEGKGWKGGGG